MEALRQSVLNGLNLLEQAVAEGKRLDEEYDEAVRRYAEKQSLLSDRIPDMEEKRQKLESVITLMGSENGLFQEYEKLAAEMPETRRLLSEKKNEWRTDLNSLQQQLNDLKSQNEAAIRAAVDEERNRCQQLLAEKQKLVSDVRLQKHRLMNKRTDERNNLDQEMDETFEKLKGQMKEQTEEWERNFYEQQGQKNLKKKQIRDEKKRIGVSISEEMYKLEKQMDLEEFEIAKLNFLMETVKMADPPVAAAANHQPAVSESRDWDQRIRRVTFSEDLPAYVTGSDQSEVRLLGNGQETGQGDGGRHRLKHFTLSLSDEDDDNL